METASVKTNYLLNLINTVSGLLFPLITFPYASRILMAEGIGTFQFFDTTIGYILIITSLGIPLYAVRAVAKVRDNPVERSKTATEILILHALLTIAAYLCVFIVACTVSRIKADIPLFLIVSASLFFTAIGAQWFYQAIEDFRYITIRSVLVKIAAAAALFIFVKTKSDLLWYAAVNTGATVGNNLFNFFRLRKYISFKGFGLHELHPGKHLGRSLKVFPLNLIISVYLLLDVQMLGYLNTEASIGYYTAATKLTKMSLGIVTALGAVLLPRFSHLVHQKREAEFKDLGNKAISFTAALTLPMTAGLILLADPIILTFSGSGYRPSILTLQIIAPITFFIGFSSFIGMQILYPLGKENLVIAATAAGAAVNVALNFLLIPPFAQYGAAASTLAAECTVMASALIMGRKYLPFSFLSRQNFNYLVGTLIMGAAVWLISRWEAEPWKILVTAIPSGVCIYFGYLALCRDHFIKVGKEMLTGSK